MEIHLLFILFISAGLALGIYGVVIQQGANLVRMDLRTTLIAVRLKRNGTTASSG